MEDYHTYYVSKFGVLVHNVTERKFMKRIEGYVDKACEEFGFPKSFVFAVMGFVAAFNGEEKALPIIGGIKLLK